MRWLYSEAREELADIIRAFVCFFHLNPLAYTDVPETAGLARSINP